MLYNTYKKFYIQGSNQSLYKFLVLKNGLHRDITVTIGLPGIKIAQLKLRGQNHTITMPKN